MNKFSLIVIFFIIVVVLALAGGNWKRSPALQSANPQALQSCPDEKIVNRMPMIGEGTQGGSSYYIVKGERKEISDYDAAWVAANCNVPEQVVY